MMKYGTLLSLIFWKKHEGYLTCNPIHPLSKSTKFYHPGQKLARELAASFLPLSWFHQNILIPGQHRNRGL